MVLPSPAPTGFTPLLSLTGGLMIGGSAALLWLGLGRIAGISGIVGGVMERAERDWRLAFIAGLLAAGVLARMFDIAPTISLARSDPLLVGAGLLVGVGTALGGGCTSGHGICGLSRSAPRSLVATAVFMAIAFVVVFVTHSWGGG